MKPPSAPPLASPRGADVEKGQRLAEWHATQRDQDLSLHARIAAQAARDPGALAVAGAGSRLTYSELCARAARLAVHLRSLGIGPEGLVGICLDRSPELVVAALGVLTAGGAYLPLDPRHPAERLAYILADAAIPVLITSRALAGDLPAGAARVVLIDEACAGTANTAAGAALVPQSLAYVIYTSGSTGRPKGTELTHGGLLNLVAWHGREHGITPADRTAQVASPAFDAAVWEIWPTLAAGASLHVPPAEVLLAPADLLAWLAAERITVCFLPTPLAEACLAFPLPPDLALRALLTGGDRLHRVGRDLPFRLVNHYGPTESTVVATAGAVATGARSAAVPPIGRPIAKTRAHLLDAGLSPVPSGEPGELAIAGAGLARGYLRRPTLTAEKFVPDPWAGDGPGSRLYRTGDLARHLPDGDLEFLGRIDHQVKIRGFRIELQEIEAALDEHPGVAQSVVVAADGPGGVRRLVAYLVPRGDVGGETDALVRAVEAALRARLPEHMVPAAFVLLAELPLSPNGKVDRGALPAPAARRSATDGEPVDLRTPTEEALAGIWSELLGVPRIGRADGFLELGGHSLLAVQVIARVRERLGADLELHDVFASRALGELAARIEQARGAAAGGRIVPLPRLGDLPLSFAQERIWFLQQLDPTIRSYQFQAKMRCTGWLDVAALRRSLAEVVRRHEIFRTTFPTVGGRPAQRIQPAAVANAVALPVVDLSGLAGEVRALEAERVVAAECRRPFDVARLPLVRWALLRLAPAEHVWLHVEHHLVHDGWSFNRILEELSVLYAAFSRGEPSPLPELPVQFADWAVWQREWTRGPQAAAQIEFWRRTLSGRPAVLDLPTDRPRPRRQSFVGSLERLEMPADLCAALRSASRREGVSLFMLMEAGFAALLARYAGQDQVNVGSAVANRRWRETEPILGMIVDNVVLANDLAGDPTARELLQRTWQVCLESASRQDVPFDLVVEAVQPERDLAYNPLFQTAFSFHDSPLGTLRFPGLAVEVTEGLSNGSAKFDVNVICIPRRERRVGRGESDEPAGDAESGITLIWEYATALFDRTTALRMIGSFQTVLAGLAAQPLSRVAELPLLTAEEEWQLQRWSGTEAELAQVPQAGVHELFEAQVDRDPEALAAAGGGSRLTYGELEALANRLARRLRGCGVGPEVRVGVCLERSPALIAALLAVLKAGAAYLPLDPGHPAERLGSILADAAVPVLITTGELARRLPTGDARVLALDEEDLDRFDQDTGAARLRVPVSPESLAYVIFTSGSTGRPKGTELSHAGLLNLIGWHRRVYGITPADRTTQVASPAFDAAVWEIWPALAAGASLHVPPDAVRAAPDALLAWLANERITVCFLPTPLAEACLALPMAMDLALRALLTGGDRLHAVARTLPFRLVNHYGPTESTVVATAGDVAAGAASPPIGRPIDRVCGRVVDRGLQPVPPGVTGQLLLGGAGLARGYLRRPELTAERFIPNPFARGDGGPGDAPGSRLYCTGDLVRWRTDGQLDFLARTDQQIKIRGFRVEPGEVEAVLRAHLAVQAAAVVVRDAGDGPRLVGYAVLAEGFGQTTTEDLRAYLAARLPAPMVPSAVVLLAALPLTANGKVDLAALPEPAAAAADGDGWHEPRTEIERLLQEIWSELTGVARVGICDDFFRLGGHSLLGARMLSRLRDALDVDLPLSTVFERPTIAALAAAVEDRFLEQQGLAAEEAF